MEKRRTQGERRAETRQKLMDATIRCLVDYGYPATTGRRVSEIAEVSRGAQTHHYPQMFDLISDAVEHLADRRAEEMRTRAGALRGTKAQVPGLVDLLWEDYSSDLFKAVVKLWVAAADDPALRKRLSPLERHLRGVVRSVVDSIIGDLGATEEVGRNVDVVMNAIRGLALTEGFEPRERRPSHDRWASMRPLLIELLKAPSK